MILALDIGTTKLCALAWNPAAAKVASVHSAPNDATVGGLPSGRHEQDPAQVVAGVHALLRNLLADPAVDRAAVTGIAITGQVHGAMLVDGGGEPRTNFITWRDQRTAWLVDAANAADPGGPSRTGGPLSGGYGALLLSAWMQDGAIPPGAKAVSVLDYVAFSLCGVLATETTHAASWGLVDLRSMDWDAPRIEALGIAGEALPPLRPACAPLGPLRAEVAAQFALPASVVVLSPVGDNQAGVIGVAGFEPGACVVNLGTGGQVSCVRADFAVDPPLETRPMPFGGFLQVGASLCGGEAYAILARFYGDVAREIAGAALTQEQLYARMNEAAARADAEAGGLGVDTRFGGTRQDPAVRGAIRGLGVANLTAGNLARAVVTGMVRELADMIRRPGLPPVRKLFACGNGVRKNPLAADAIAREFGVPCTLSSHREEAAVGAALCAARSIKIKTIP